MPYFVRISDSKYVNLDDVRDICINPDKEELELTVTWRGSEESIDVFEGEDAVRLMGLVQLYSVAALKQLHEMSPPDEPTED